MSRVTIKLNRQEDESGRLAIFTRFHDEDAYQDGDTLEQVWDGYVPTGETVRDTLNAVWPKFNRGAPGFIGDDEYPQRSLSVGDVVVVDGQSFYVDHFGFKEITHPGVAVVG